MTTDTKPSEAALEIARKISADMHLVGPGTNEYLANFIDAGVRELREALESVVDHGHVASCHREFGCTCAYSLAETALRAWRTK